MILLLPNNFELTRIIIIYFILFYLKSFSQTVLFSLNVKFTTPPACFTFERDQAFYGHT